MLLLLSKHLNPILTFESYLSIFVPYQINFLFITNYLLLTQYLTKLTILEEVRCNIDVPY